MTKSRAIRPPSYLCRSILPDFIGVGSLRVAIAMVILSVVDGSQIIGCDANAAMIAPNGLRIKRNGRLRFEAFHSGPSMWHQFQICRAS